MSPYRILLAVFAALSLLAGCHPYAVADDIDIDFNFTLLVGPSDSLHLPYVRGTQVTLSVVGAGNTPEEQSHFTLKSADDSILHCVSQQDASALCNAVGTGSVDVQVLRDGQQVYTTEITVKAPTRAVLQPNGPLIVGDPIEQKVDSTTHVLAGGTSTYLVEYFAGDEQLYGNGVLVATPEDGLTATPVTTFLFENREWLQLSPAATGKLTVSLEGSGVALGTLTVDAVDETAVTSVSVEAEDASHAHKNDELAVLAQSFDAKNEPIFGIDYTWTNGGVEQTGEGDLFRYQFDGSESATLSAHFGDKSASTTIEAVPGSGMVDSSNNVGCSAAPGSPSSNWVGLALVGLALAGAARSRRRR